MRIRSTIIACTFALCALPVTTLADQPASSQYGYGAGEDLSYTYFGGQLGFGGVDFDGPVDGDGLILNLNGSASLTPHVHALGRYNHTFGGDFDTDMLSLGGGYHTTLPIEAPFRLDVFGNLTFEYLNVDAGNASNDDLGLGLRAGLRARFTPRITADASVGYVDYGSVDGPVFQLGGVYEVNNRLGLRANFRHYSLDAVDINQFLVGVRYYPGDFLSIQ